MTQFSELHDSSSKPWTQLSSFTALVFLLLTQNCSGLLQVVGPSQPVLATVGGDVLLSCWLEPAIDASDMSVEWFREDLNPSYVYVWWYREELESLKHPDYKGRTSMLFSKLEFGDISLKLSKVKPSDEGKYRCFIPTLGRGCTVELVVGDFLVSQSSYISTLVGLATTITLLILAVVLFVHTGGQNSKTKTLEEKNQILMVTKKTLLDEKLKLMETEGKLKAVIQNMMQELDEMNFDTNSDPTGSDEKNQQEELEKLQDEKQKWMETVVNLKTELQNMNQELEVEGPITLAEVDERDHYISLQNSSSEVIKLEGWMLEVQRNYGEIVTYTFKESDRIQAGRILCMRGTSWLKHPRDVNLLWSELEKWNPGDNLQFKLISNDGKIFKLL